MLNPDEFNPDKAILCVMKATADNVVPDIQTLVIDVIYTLIQSFRIKLTHQKNTRLCMDQDKLLYIIDSTKYNTKYIRITQSQCGNRYTYQSTEQILFTTLTSLRKGVHYKYT